MKEWKRKTGYKNDFVNRFIYFGRNSSIQGLKYVFHEKGSRISRLIWLLLLIGFTGCLYLLLVPVVQRGGSVSITPDTRYLKWNTKFPGVTVCEKYAPKEVQKKLLQHYPGLLDALNLDYRRHIADIVYGRGSCRKEVCSPCGTLVPCDVVWKKIIEKVHKKCDELITDCHFNDVEFSCCEHFNNVDSEYGQCFSLHSLQGPYVTFLLARFTERHASSFDQRSKIEFWTRHRTQYLLVLNCSSLVHKKCDELITDCHFNDVEFSCCEYFNNVDSEYGQCFSLHSLQGPYTEDLQFFVNRSTGPGVLSFRLLSDSQISVHSPEELSTNALDKKYKFDVRIHLDQVVNYLFSIVEVDNEPVLENEDINLRKCRYAHEIPDLPLHTYQVYSYGACRLARTTEESFHMCHCVHPVRDIRYKDLYCNYTGMNCLITYEVQKIKLGIKDNISDAVDCLPACVESELHTIDILKGRRPQSQDNFDGALVNITMVSLPTMRYQKSLLRTNLDFVVSVGGMVGLFFSASILSFAEIFYLIFRSPNK